MAKIDRDAAIAVMFRRYHEAAKSWNERGKDADYGAMVALDRAGNELAKLPAEEDRPAFRWIPLSERKPGEGEAVLISGTFGLSIGWPDDKADGLWFINCGERCAVNDDIKAWAPMPEPYKEESDG